MKLNIITNTDFYIFIMSRQLLIILIILLLTASLVQSKTNSKSSKASQRKRPNSNHRNHQHTYLSPDSIQFWLNAALATFLACAGGFCSGMTVGLNSLSTLNLQIMLKSTEQKDKVMAERILNVIHDHHLFLVTLLVGNAIVLQSLPLVIHTIMPDWAAILFSTVIVLVVAEVVPMSLSTGSNKYIIAYYGSPLVFWPICYPIARGLDRLLGTEHEQRILRRDFLTFINDKKQNYLHKLQIQFINQVMNYQNKSVKELMTPFSDLFMLEEDQIITKVVMDQLHKGEFNYIFIYSKQKKNIVGYVKTKEIVMKYLQASKEEFSVKQLVKGFRNPVRVYSDAITIQALSILEKYRTKILLVCEDKKHSQQKSQKSIVTVYQDKQWVISSSKSNVIGVVTLNKLLCEIADYPTTTLKTWERKLSLKSEQEQI